MITNRKYEIKFTLAFHHKDLRCWFSFFSCILDRTWLNESIGYDEPYKIYKKRSVFLNIYYIKKRKKWILDNTLFSENYVSKYSFSFPSVYSFEFWRNIRTCLVSTYSLNWILCLWNDFSRVVELVSLL